MLCPSCGHHVMLFHEHHGMEHNVCEQCGTVIECNPLVVDVYQAGSREVQPSYHSERKTYKRGLLLNPHLKAFGESKEIMTQLMDRLNIPFVTRELALHYLQHSKFLNRRCCVGACVYLAMKRHDIPITIKYISNYLQVSHFSVGRAMKKLEERIGVIPQSNLHGVSRFAHLIFNQAKFGGSEQGKKRFDILLSKTEEILQLLESQTPINYQPHIIILAAGYIVWRNLKCHGWGEEKCEASSSETGQSCLNRPTLKSFLIEVGIQLSNLTAVYEKVNVITKLMCKMAAHIPWISGKTPSKNMVYFHLDDFIKYKSQLIALNVRSMEKEQVIKLEEPSETPEESSLELCQSAEQSATSALWDCEVSNDSQSAKEDISHTISDTSQQDFPKCNFSANFDTNMEYAGLAKAESDKEKEKNGLVFRKVKYTRLRSLYKRPFRYKKCKNERDVSNSGTYQTAEAGSSCDQFVETTFPQLIKDESYLKSLSFP